MTGLTTSEPSPGLDPESTTVLDTDDDSWSDNLDVAATQLLDALEWQLAQVRLRYLKPQGWEARRRVFAARDRVFTALTGVAGADAAVVARGVALAEGTARAGDPASRDLDSSLTGAIDQWRQLDLAAYWKAVGAYAATVSDSVAEQIMLLTYLQSFLEPAEPDSHSSAAASDPDAPIEVIGAVGAVARGRDVRDVYAACGALTSAGTEASKPFTTRIALLSLAAAAPDQEGGVA